MAEQTTQPAAQAATPEATTQAPATQTPGKIFDKYDNMEQATKAYKELNATLTRQAQELATYKKGGSTETTETATAPKGEAPKAEAQNDLYVALVQEFRTNSGKLSDATKEIAAKKLGAPVAFVEKMEAMFKAEAEAGLGKLNGELKAAGINMTAEQIEQEAHKHLSPAQLKRLQDDLNDGFTGMFIEVGKRVAAKAAKDGAAPATGRVDNGGGSVGGYSTVEEIHAATKSLMTNASQSLKAEVERRIAATPQSIVNEWQNYSTTRRKK